MGIRKTCCVLYRDSRSPIVIPGSKAITGFNSDGNKLVVNELVGSPRFIHNAFCPEDIVEWVDNYSTEISTQANVVVIQDDDVSGFRLKENQVPDWILARYLTEDCGDKILLIPAQKSWDDFCIYLK